MVSFKFTMTTPNTTNKNAIKNSNIFILKNLFFFNKNSTKINIDNEPTNRNKKSVYNLKLKFIFNKMPKEKKNKHLIIGYFKILNFDINYYKFEND